MYSTIFQIGTAPIKNTKYISEYDEYDTWFFDQICSYVMADIDRDKSIECFREKLSLARPFVEFFVNEDGDSGFVIRDRFRYAYFGKKLAKFWADLYKLSKAATLERFIAGGLDANLSRLQADYNDRFGFYIYGFTDDLITLDEFLRRAELNTPYYFGGTVGYHFL